MPELAQFLEMFQPGVRNSRRHQKQMVKLSQSADRGQAGIRNSGLQQEQRFEVGKARHVLQCRVVDVGETEVHGNDFAKEVVAKQFAEPTRTGRLSALM